MTIGYFLSSEETAPGELELVHKARLVKQAGFDGLWISGHFHPCKHERLFELYAQEILPRYNGAGGRAEVGAGAGTV
jgi:alkanesulfonate monooxygenase SsuD/methylene tetrahydromethanopterin reductase-like flavin-dependent oxidoreductase (luciferase family)